MCIQWCKSFVFCLWPDRQWKDLYHVRRRELSVWTVFVSCLRYIRSTYSKEWSWSLGFLLRNLLWKTFWFTQWPQCPYPPLRCKKQCKYSRTFLAKDNKCENLDASNIVWDNIESHSWKWHEHRFLTLACNSSNFTKKRQENTW